MPTKPNIYVLVQTPEDDPMEREHTSRVRVPDLTIAKLVSRDADDGTVIVRLPARTVDGHKVPAEEALLETSSVFGLEWAEQLSDTSVCLDLMTLKVPDQVATRPWQTGGMIVDIKHNGIQVVSSSRHYKLSTSVDLSKWRILPALSPENRGQRVAWARRLLVSGASISTGFRSAVVDLTLHHLQNSALNAL